MTNSILNHLQPAKVFEYFQKISEIPRGSGNERAISDFLIEFSKKHHLYHIRDNALNIIIKKRASPGYENKPIVVLQGHMDMVCEKNEGTIHDFEKEPIKLRIVDDMIYATGTTLGADNGVAVAMGLALLSSNEITHPAIELILTTDEERGMAGAMQLDPKNIDGRILINLDSAEEGVFTVGCAGGPTVKTNIPIIWNDSTSNLLPHIIKIRGLKGGHSGEDIHRGRANVHKLMGRILMALNSEVEFSIASINGGMKYNAIPREASCTILLKSDDKIKAYKKVIEYENIFKYEFRVADPNIEISFEAIVEEIPKVFSTETKNKIMNYLYLIDNGINSMSMDIHGLVESSVNLGVVTTKLNEVEFLSLIRSSVKSLYIEMFQRIEAFTKIIGAEVEMVSNCPLWQYNSNSKIRTIFEKVYTKMYGQMPEITILHAGLECGIFEEKFNGEMDMISFGPNMYELHTPEEHLSISSIQRSWDFLLQVLKEIK
ncbi:aminoacyl-histidine dipeptidase [Clostridiaceae bacterium 35-E11]